MAVKGPHRGQVELRNGLAIGIEILADTTADGSIHVNVPLDAALPCRPLMNRGRYFRFEDASAKLLVVDFLLAPAREAEVPRVNRYVKIFSQYVAAYSQCDLTDNIATFAAQTLKPNGNVDAHFGISFHAGGVCLPHERAAAACHAG